MFEKGQCRPKKLCEKAYCFQITTVANSKKKKNQYKSISEKTPSMFFYVKELTKDCVTLVDKITKAGHFYAKFKCIFFSEYKK